MNYWIWYATLQTLNRIQKKKLLELFQNPNNIFKLKKEELLNLKFLKQSNIEEILQNRDLILIAKYENYMNKMGIKMINLTDNNYPQKLKNIYDPPISLFFKGNLSLLNEFSIAIIGCREASTYGLKIAKQMAYELSENHITIVSGMAKGIDGIAHQGSIDAKGKTIAVLGTGVDYPYPFENIEIYQKILKNNGLIVSEYLVGTKPKPKNFPARNRIISALSEGVLVVEAKKKSGTMITVDFALEQGKNVYVIPGNINSSYSEGTNELIKQGAKLVSNIEDILEDF